MPINLTETLKETNEFTLVKINSIIINVKNSEMIIHYKRGYIGDITNLVDGEEVTTQGEILEANGKEYILSGQDFINYFIENQQLYNDVKTASYDLLKSNLGFDGTIS